MGYTTIGYRAYDTESVCPYCGAGIGLSLEKPPGRRILGTAEIFVGTPLQVYCMDPYCLVWTLFRLAERKESTFNVRVT